MISNFLRRVKSVIEREVVLEMFPARETDAMMEAMDLFQEIFLLLNRTWFHANQIELSKLIIAEFTTSLHCRLEYMSLVFHIS